jgi:hypothetical protein
MRLIGDIHNARAVMRHLIIFISAIVHDKSRALAVRNDPMWGSWPERRTKGGAHQQNVETSVSWRQTTSPQPHNFAIGSRVFSISVNCLPMHDTAARMEMPAAPLATRS